MKNSVKRLWCGTLYSLAGLKYAIQNEWAFRVEAVVFILLIPATFFLASDALHRFLLVGSLILILVCELLNSAIESLTDRVSLDQHPLSKSAKDLGSASVFVACMFSASIWMWSLWECCTETSF